MSESDKSVREWWEADFNSLRFIDRTEPEEEDPVDRLRGLKSLQKCAELTLLGHPCRWVLRKNRVALAKLDELKKILPTRLFSELVLVAKDYIFDGRNLHDYFNYGRTTTHRPWHYGGTRIDNDEKREFRAALEFLERYMPGARLDVIEKYRRRRGMESDTSTEDDFTTSDEEEAEVFWKTAEKSNFCESCRQSECGSDRCREVAAAREEEFQRMRMEARRERRARVVKKKKDQEKRAKKEEETIPIGNRPEEEWWD